MRVTKCVFIATAILLFLSSCTFSQAKIETTKAGKIDAYVNTVMKRYEVPGYALAIIKDGEVIYRKNYGKANIEHSVPITDKSIFRVYSITKIFVATGIFQLIEQGKLSLEDPISKYVDGLPKDWQQIKIKYLLTHSSGLPDMAPFFRFQDLNEEQAKEIVFSEKITSASGEEYSYNQTNFWLLQKVIEKVSDKTYSDFLLGNQFGSSDKNVFFSSDSRDIIPNRTTSYFSFVTGKMQIDDAHTGDFLASANGLNITLNEFIGWNKKFDQNAFLKKETKAKMWEPFEYKRPHNFSYGWGLYPVNNGMSYGFTGSLTTGFRKFPKDDLAIILLGNGFDRVYQIDTVIEYIAGIVDEDLESATVKTNEALTAGFLEGDFESTFADLDKLKMGIPDQEFENSINSYGYVFLGQGELQKAIKLFKYNTENSPNSWNVWDSLGEAYLAEKNYELSLRNYQKSVELNPNSNSGKEAINKIRLLTNGGASAIPKSEQINKLKEKSDSQKFDKAISEFMLKHDIPGLSFAFAKDGEILFASGYGYADKERQETVNIENRFRMASISKPITSAAILTLVEQKKLSLNDKVFGKDGIFKGKYLKKPDPNIELIEVRQLLQHTAAPEWSNQGGIEDPMFVHFELSQEDLIRKTLMERKVKNKPGTAYTYSNFGYCVLGRIIEKVSGKSYEKYVQDLISKHGIKSFAITGDGLAAKAENESYYFFERPNNPNVPYSFPAARMDSHGGWISTAIDLVKFAQLVDGFPKPKDILSPKTIELMKTPSKISPNYGLGWGVNELKNSWHGGSLPGTSSTLVNTHDGMTWSILANKRGIAETYYDELDALTWEIIKDVEL